LQEGMVSLVQMARTADAVHRFRRAGKLFVAVLRPHTTGGVYASWASLADVTAAQPGATIGFGGPRVVEQVTGFLPPPESHTAEYAFAHGLVDALVAAPDQWQWAMHTVFGPAPALLLPPGRPVAVPTGEVPVDPWAVLLHARRADRPSGLEWASLLTSGWVEVRGADPVLRAGIANIAGRSVMVVAMDRHASATARPGPEAFALAHRAFALAERVGLPVLTLIDTPGAEPGPGAEAGGLARQIAHTLLAMAALSVPSVALCVGEGGSGAAMALAHTDRLLILDGAVFTVIGPEAGASVLYRDASRAPELARAFRLTAPELLELGVVDAVLAEADPVAVQRAVVAALDTARPGDRNARADALTRRCLTPTT
jgi:acetyl-CoA carboxylase carboxyl transferase subunit beta